MEELEDSLLAAIGCQYPIRTDAVHTGIMGYSLGGLFALWAMCDSRMFDRAVSFARLALVPWMAGFFTPAFVRKNLLRLSVIGRQEREGRPYRHAYGAHVYRADGSISRAAAG